jgi:hypothetical protein
MQLDPSAGEAAPPNVSTTHPRQAPGSNSSSSRGQDHSIHQSDGSSGGSSSGGSSSGGSSSGGSSDGGTGSVQRVASMASSYDTASEGDGLSGFWLQGEHTCHFITTCPSSPQLNRHIGDSSSSSSPGVLCVVRRAWAWATDRLGME